MNNQKKKIPPDRILAGAGSSQEGNKVSLIDGLHNIDILIDDLYNKGSRIRDQHKKDSLLDGLNILVVEIINEQLLIALKTGSSSSQDYVWRYAPCFILKSTFIHA